MNTETREIKMWDNLTEAEKKSGKWVPLEDGVAGLAGAAIEPRETFKARPDKNSGMPWRKKVKVDS